MQVVIRASYRGVLLIDAIVFFIYSISALIYTAEMLDLHGVTLNQAGVFTAQIAGAAFFAFSAMNLLARELEDAKAIRLVMNVNLIKHSIALMVCVGNFMTGALSDRRSMSFVLLFLLFTIVFGAFQFSKKEYVKAGGAPADNGDT